MKLFSGGNSGTWKIGVEASQKHPSLMEQKEENVLDFFFQITEPLFLQYQSFFFLMLYSLNFFYLTPYKTDISDQLRN